LDKIGFTRYLLRFMACRTRRLPKALDTLGQILYPPFIKPAPTFCKKQFKLFMWFQHVASQRFHTMQPTY